MIIRLLVIFLLLGLPVQSQILSERERAEKTDEILADKFENLLPQLMDRAGIDMWVIISREYNEDPVLRTMLPGTWLNARRRTILVFHRDRERDTLERIAVARYNIGKNIISAWDPEEEPDQWKALIDIIEERTPATIGLNYSKDFALADGLVKTDHDEFLAMLPAAYKDKIVSAEELAVGWIETRSQKEMELYESLVAQTHAIIAEAFSNKVITPGVTTSEDVVWWMRQKVTELGLETWFHPTVDIQRKDEALKDHIEAFSAGYGETVIQPGDLLHCDFGITYLRLNTDCQQHAYVLKPGELTAPAYLREALEKGNRLQDILTTNFQKGRTGNEILAVSLTEAKDEGLRPSIYTHPLGLYGHSAGPTIGMWDSQGGVPGTGDYPLYPNTVYAIELNTTVEIPEWEKDIRIMLEEAGFYGEDGFKYVNGRQQELYCISSK
ncbi:aminopeptidase P family protein [Antarcticibacterium flavum]|uniref:Aminopeptidase P family protein n=1 Tax=Antarcticibacterium flavum TaxID=2058175 RepID=A0A5B7X7X7_9FLAO|nr:MULTISPECIES: M24 family metallopeptidase [Antarcticibacterium]MCM4159600.1 Xaa-Pro aminopeptidase [Antarcticibacterium sp. W02-3]QCY70848.1 aminopeptidase P family protein [Antarcticibacterium flavum]